MALIVTRIKALAFLGRTPREIEKVLGFTPYTIHKLYNSELQAGYQAKENNIPLNNDERREMLRWIHKGQKGKFSYQRS